MSRKDDYKNTAESGSAVKGASWDRNPTGQPRRESDNIEKTVPYEGGTYRADAVPENEFDRGAGYFGEVMNGNASEPKYHGNGETRGETAEYEPRETRETRGETTEYGQRYHGKEYGTEAAADLFAGAMFSGADPLGSYTGRGLTKFGNRLVYFPPHDDEIIPVQDADDL